MTTVTDPLARTVTSKEAQRNWKIVTDKALRAPVVITAHGRPRHVLMAYDHYERLRTQTRQTHRTADLPPDLARDVLDGLNDLRTPRGVAEDGDTIGD